MNLLPMGFLVDRNRAQSDGRSVETIPDGDWKFRVNCEACYKI